MKHHADHQAKPVANNMLEQLFYGLTDPDEDIESYYGSSKPVGVALLSFEDQLVALQSEVFNLRRECFDGVQVPPWPTGFPPWQAQPVREEPLQALPPPKECDARLGGCR